MRFVRWLTLLVICALALLVPGVSSAQGDPTIETRYFGDVALDQLSRGATGGGTLIYYSPEATIERPSLVVRLLKTADADVAVAQVFDAPADKTFVPITIQNDRVVLDASLKPTLIINALNGWWVKDGLVNYNLDIQVNGAVEAMFGSSWKDSIQAGTPAVAITVRDPDNEGIPTWDLRTLRPEFPGSGFPRTNYAERKCKTPLNVVPSVSPLWPYVAATGSFEQRPGQFHPPIGVDWANGNVSFFSELVTVRNQNCSYSLYSIQKVAPGQLNHANFETPFAFYDLSGQGQGYPNMILRTQHFPAKDPWSVGIEPDVQQGRPVPTDFETVRYSWRNAVGDWNWDYKIEVMGFHSYTATTIIGDGLATIDAPDYEEFPSWVIGRAWPVTTFIDTEGRSYQSSEGLYDWSPLEVGVGYAFGWQNARKLEAFTSIRTGLRGEYRSQRTQQPTLYLSPIDNRLHLLAAEGGLWSLSDTQALRLANLSGGDYIDSWARLRVEPGQPIMPTGGDIEEQLAALGNFLIYSAAGHVELRPYTGPRALLTTLPPTDKTSWQQQRAALEPFTSAKRDPQNLKSWLAVAPAGGLSVAGAQFTDLRAAGQGFRFVLQLQPGFQVQGDDLLGLAGLPPGSYAVSYDGAFHVEPLSLPILDLRAPAAGMSAEPAVALQAGRLRLQLSSAASSADAPLVAVRAEALAPDGRAVPIGERQLAVLAGATTPVTFDWAPPAAGDWQIRVTAITTPTLDAPPMTAHFDTTLPVAPAELPSVTQAASAFGLVPLPALAGLLLAALITAGLLVCFLALPAAARRKL